MCQPIFSQQIATVIASKMTDHIVGKYLEHDTIKLAHHIIQDIVEDSYEALQPDSDYYPPDPFSNPDFIRYLVLSNRINSLLDSLKLDGSYSEDSVQVITDRLFNNLSLYDFWQLPSGKIISCDQLQTTIKERVDPELRAFFDFAY